MMNMMKFDDTEASTQKRKRAVTLIPCRRKSDEQPLDHCHAPPASVGVKMPPYIHPGR
jgi:hypothetical protein